MFKDHAIQYFENDLYVIPLNGKIPLVKNWSFFAKNKPSELLVDSWINKFPNANIGLLTGKLSGVIAIDIDKDSALEIVPPSPLGKKGKKGETRFFKYNGEINFKRHDLGIELLSDGNQTVIPPSIHPETKQAYVWTTHETFDSIDVEDLPILDQAFLDKVANIPSMMKPDDMGRHNTLIEICGAMVGRGEDATSIIDELLKYDKENHTPSYFTDTSEPHKGSGYHAALSMYASVAKTAKQKGEFVEPIKIDLQISSEIAESEIQKKIDQSSKFAHVKFPEPRGMVKVMQDEILKRSHKKRPTFALASALSTIGLVLSNKVCFRDNTPNVYMLLIAESGEGKDVPLKAGKKFLIETGLIHLLGLSEYRGDKSIVKKFESQRERLDIIDEISKLFRSFKSNNNYTNSISELLTEIWNSSFELFTGFTTSEETTGMCFNPCLSFVGATTPGAFSDTFSNSFLMQGFGGRFLYFFDDARVDLLTPSRGGMPDDMDYFLSKWGNMEIESEEVDITKTGTVKFDFSGKKPQAVAINSLDKPSPKDIGIEEDAEEFMFKKMHYFHELSYTCNESIRPIVQRAFQQMCKICISYQIGLDDPYKDETSPISLEAATFAFEFVEASIKSTDLFFKENLIQSKFHKDSQKVIRVLKRHPKGLTKGELTKKLVNQFKSSELYDKKNGVITNLVEAGKILAYKTKAEGSHKETIRFIYDRSEQ